MHFLSQYKHKHKQTQNKTKHKAQSTKHKHNRGVTKVNNKAVQIEVNGVRSKKTKKEGGTEIKKKS
jgi:hypothetical protein